MQQTTVSQILARLRLEGLVKFRRKGVKSVYSITSDWISTILSSIVNITREAEEEIEYSRQKKFSKEKR